MSAKEVLIGILIGTSGAGGVAAAVSPDLVAKFGALYGEPQMSSATFDCDGSPKCQLSVSKVAAPADEDAVKLGVQPLRWNERGVCSAEIVSQCLGACGQLENLAAPGAFVERRRGLVDGLVVDVAEAVQDKP